MMSLPCLQKPLLTTIGGFRYYNLAGNNSGRPKDVAIRGILPPNVHPLSTLQFCNYGHAISRKLP